MTDRRELDDRRETDSQGVPWWVRAIAFVGVPSAIACFLVWTLAGDVRTEATRAANTSLANASALVEHQKHTEQLHQNIEKYMNSQLLLMRLLCSNSARSAEERRACFQQ